MSEVEYDRAEDLSTGTSVERAVKLFVRARQSDSGRMQEFTRISTSRLRRGMNEQSSSWLSAIKRHLRVHKRLQRVCMLNEPAVDVLKLYNKSNVFTYIDPPYPHETRTAPNVYQCEMTDEDHLELLFTVRKFKGRVMLSSYPCDMYFRQLQAPKWNLTEITVKNSSGSGKKKQDRVEAVWRNYG